MKPDESLKPAGTRALVDTPQRWGILPTMWFWRGRADGIIRLPMAIASGLWFFLVTRLYGALPGSIGLDIAYTLVAFGGSVALLGGAEKLLRAKALARRERTRQLEAQLERSERALAGPTE